MTRLPLISSKQMEKMLFQLGFEKVRQKGSHAIRKFITVIVLEREVHEIKSRMTE